jgi:hypothetical protein
MPVLNNMIKASEKKVRRVKGPDLHPSISIKHPELVMPEGHENHHYEMTPPVPHPPKFKGSVK